MKGPLRKILLAPPLFLIRFYQVVLSPILPPACRYEPTCSEYLRQALLEWGIFQGTLLGVRRILRCHPLVPGGFDPVPSRPEEAEAATPPPPPRPPRPPGRATPPPDNAPSASPS